MYEDSRAASGKSRAAWKEPVYEMGRGERYGGGRAVRREPVRENRKVDREVDIYRAERRKKAESAAKRSRKSRKKSAARRVLAGLFLYFFLVGIAATCLAIFAFLSGWSKKVQAQDAMESGGIVTGTAEETVQSADGETESRPVLEITPEIRQECQNIYAGQESLLVLVNRDHELQASGQPVLRSICKGRLEAADILYEDLCAMLEDGGKAGYQYWIASAYRDRSYQQGLVEEDVEKYMAKGYTYEAALQKTYEYTMPAGQSEHETGLALDILCSTNTIMDESQAHEPGNKWLTEHCHEYGFILRYPEDGEDITGIKYEPWHFRYVGREAAAYLTEKGWTLEEFHEVINAGRI